uniref:Putative reverse transcriptase n=1 Tax=Closterium baillyanum TaxID=1416941 RepID=A0A191T5Z8_9VIRI|nr:putative reverse transcriptase [Closterium baillyanum]ANI25818.1 putative reverse transcriptase [Closterium baillyanum]
MINNLENITMNFLKGPSAVSGLSDYYFILSNHRLLKKMLEEHWQTLLSVYTESKNDSVLYHKMHSSYFLHIQLPCDYNYLFLAKIVDFVCNTNKLQYIVRQLTKKEIQHRQLEFLVSKKSATPIPMFPLGVPFCRWSLSEESKTLGKSVFVRWLLRLWIAQFNRYIKRHSLYLAKSQCLLAWQNIEIQYFAHSLLLGSKDFLILKLYSCRSQIWYTSSDQYNPSNITHNILKLSGEPSKLSSVESPIEFRAQSTTSHRKKLVLPTDLLELQSKLPPFCQQKYINLIKDVIRCNKISIQAHLIQKINKIIRCWDRSLLNIFKKDEYKKLNHILYQSLYLWAISRHSQQPARWIKKRYWHNFEDGLYFCAF